jgi:hypothetical protein
MKLPKETHASRPWRIHELTPDFRVEDVWALSTPGARAEDFPLFVEQFAAGSTEESHSAIVRTLFAIRWKLGELLGWDDEKTGVGSRVPSLRDRLPEDLRESPGPEFESLPFKPLYLLEDEWAAEVANKTVHGVMHMGWVPDGTGGYRGEMTVLVKPNGRFGDLYMAAIRPFRYLLVYPQVTKQIEREWLERPREPVPSAVS